MLSKDFIKNKSLPDVCLGTALLAINKFEEEKITPI